MRIQPWNSSRLKRLSQNGRRALRNIGKLALARRLVADSTNGRIRIRGPLLEASHRSLDASLRRHSKSKREVHGVRLFFASLPRRISLRLVPLEPKARAATHTARQSSDPHQPPAAPANNKPPTQPQPTPQPRQPKSPNPQA